MDGGGCLCLANKLHIQDQLHWSGMLELLSGRGTELDALALRSPEGIQEPSPTVSPEKDMRMWLGAVCATLFLLTRTRWLLAVNGSTVLPSSRNWTRLVNLYSCFGSST